jgi:hypothetical protein
MARQINSLPEGSRTAVLDHHFMPYRYKDAARHLVPAGYDFLRLEDPVQVLRALKDLGATHLLVVTSQWIPRSSPPGFVLRGVYSGAYLECRWWARQARLDFLTPVFNSKGAVLFRIETAEGPGGG